MKIIKTFGFIAMALATVLFCGNFNTVNAQSGSLEWRGTVDDRVEVVIRGRNASVRTISGTPYNDARYNFGGGGGPWVNGRNYRASVNKQDGRGRVHVIQQPSRRNNYTSI